MFNITSEEFKKYHEVANKVIDVLCGNKLSSIYDIEVIYNIIRGYPYCLDTEGHYTYNQKYYNSINELPLSALEEIFYKL